MRPDLITLDIKMPKMDGFKFLEYVRSTPGYLDIPVIALTVQSHSRYVDKGITLGADFYLPKPFSLNNLMQFIEIVLGDRSI